jgi:hypothetical protein
MSVRYQLYHMYSYQREMTAGVTQVGGDRVALEETVFYAEHFGYSVKGFTLSMIETAIELTEGRLAYDSRTAGADSRTAAADSPSAVPPGAEGAG